jgi:hypothetical protein
MLSSALYHRKVKAILKSQGLDKVSTPTTFAALAQKLSNRQRFFSIHHLRIFYWFIAALWRKYYQGHSP